MGNWAILNNFEGDNSWKANQELIRKESVGNQLPTTQEWGIENDIGATISEKFRKRWGSEFASRATGSQNWGSEFASMGLDRNCDIVKYYNVGKFGRV